MTSKEFRAKLLTDDDLVCTGLVLISRDVGFRFSADFLGSLVTRIIKARTFGPRWVGPALSPKQLACARKAVLEYSTDLAGIYARHEEGIEWFSLSRGSAPATPSAPASPGSGSLATPPAPCTPLDFEEEGSCPSGLAVEDGSPRQEGPGSGSSATPPDVAVVKVQSPQADLPSAYPGGAEAHRRAHPKEFRADGTLISASDF